MVKGKSWRLVKHFDGMPNSSNFKLVEEDVSESLGAGDILCQAIYLSVDPYMRPYSIRSLKEGDQMIGQQIARITASKNSNYPVDTNILAMAGWRTHTLIHEAQFVALRVTKLPSFGALPVSLGLGTLGMPGMTAYFGLLELCHPKEGEVVLVNGAAGAVGNVVGQIAKIKGCKVIAFAGTKEKCDWLKKDLGFDHVFNYKEVDVGESIDKAAPGGIDCYFDNVGGEFTSTAFSRLKVNGRMSVCGSIADYNNASPAPVPNPWMACIFKELTISGFIVTRWADRFPEGIKQVIEWMKKGQIKYKETVTKGFENMPEAFFGLFTGANIGKAIVKV